MTTTNTITYIRELLAQIDAAEGDKPETYRVAKLLRTQVDTLIHHTQPGAGEFKWSAKTVKELTKQPGSKHHKPSIMVATSETTPGETWHTDGHYLKLGAVPKRFGDVDTINLEMRAVMQVVTGGCGGEEVTVTGSHDAPGADEVVLSNGTIVKRLYLTYVTDGFADVTLTNKGPLNPVCVHQAGVCVGLVMPVNK